MKNYFFIITLLSYASVSEAYIGPGLSAGTVGVIIGILLSILLGIFALFWYPIKRLIKKTRKSGDDQDGGKV